MIYRFLPSVIICSSRLLSGRERTVGTNHCCSGGAKSRFGRYFVVDASIAALHKQLTAAKLTSQSHQQRKQVTILFADVSGFTAMSETMNAEEVNEVMNGLLWQWLDSVIMRYNGRIGLRVVTGRNCTVKSDMLNKCGC